MWCLCAFICACMDVRLQKATNLSNPLHEQKYVQMTKLQIHLLCNVINKYSVYAKTLHYFVHLVFSYTESTILWMLDVWDYGDDGLIKVNRLVCFIGWKCYFWKWNWHCNYPRWRTLQKYDYWISRAWYNIPDYLWYNQFVGRKSSMTVESDGVKR